MTEFDQNLPIVRFDESIAERVFPRPELKRAAFVPIPEIEGVELQQLIVPEWGGVQQFLGSYYAIIIDGRVAYGSAREQWELMHVQVEGSPGLWVKTGVPMAYEAMVPCRVITLILQEDSSVRETSVSLNPGDWVLRQPGGEVQHVQAAKMGRIYFSREEALQLGLVDMTNEQFAQWAISQVDLVSV